MVAIIPAGAVVFGPDDLPLLAYLVRTTEHARRRNALPRLAALDALAVALNRHDDRPEDAGGHPETVDMISTDDAARLLGCSTRTCQRLAPQLGGRRVGRSWLLDRAAVLEHREGTA